MPGQHDDQARLSQVIARAVIDPQFRDALAKNPQQTLQITGHKLSANDVTTIKNLKPEEWSQLNMKDLNSRIGQVASWKVSSIES